MNSENLEKTINSDTVEEFKKHPRYNEFREIFEESPVLKDLVENKRISAKEYEKIINDNIKRAIEISETIKK